MDINQSANSSAILLGSNGAIIVTDTTTNTGLFYAVKAISDCVVNTATFEDSISGSLDGLTIKAGDKLDLFRITSFKLTSGQAILYKG